MSTNQILHKLSKLSVHSFLILGVTCWQAYADPVLTLEPSGNVSGPPGATVGWGYKITNDTGFYLLPSNSFFCEPGEDPQLTTCSPNLGSSTYTDFITSYVFTNSSPIPPAGLSQSFNIGLMTGVGAYSIDPAATIGSMDSGNLVIEYTEWNANPFLGSAMQENITGGELGNGVFELSAAATVTVISTAAVPEPSAVWPLAAMLLVFLGFLRKRGRTLA